MRLRDQPMPGDYVLATKYCDGDPQDHFAVGFYSGSHDLYGRARHLLTDGDGNQFRANGFRRVRKISPARGAWLIERMPQIEAEAKAGSRRSVWGWARMPMKPRR